MPRCLAWIVWCLMLALPLQGLAAASRLMCHHAQPAPSTQTRQATPCHGDEAAAADAAHAGCIACAACHGMVALPTRLPLILPTLPAQAPDAVAAALVLPFITAGPERPPRSHLA